MPDCDPDLLVSDRRECCTNSFEYIKGMTLQDFISDKKTMAAVLRYFEVPEDGTFTIQDECNQVRQKALCVTIYHSLTQFLSFLPGVQPDDKKIQSSASPVWPAVYQ